MYSISNGAIIGACMCGCAADPNAISTVVGVHWVGELPWLIGGFMISSTVLHHMRLRLKEYWNRR